jgi:hypothetical protein
LKAGTTMQRFTVPKPASPKAHSMPEAPIGPQSRRGASLRSRIARYALSASAANAIVDLFIAAFCILPLLLTAHLPLVDLPNHLARQVIIRDLPNSPYLQQFYQVQWDLVPNIGLEIFLLGARTFVSIDLAVRLFCIVTILMLFYGTRLVNREFSEGRSRLYRIAPLLCYGGPFQYGFLSFCFGIGFALLAFGAYLRLRRLALPAVVVIFAPAAFLLLLCHLAAFGLFAAAVGALELARAFEAEGRRIPQILGAVRGLSRAGCCLIPPFALFVAFSPTTVAGHETRFSTLQQKIESIAAITLFSAPALELSLLLLALAGLIIALLMRVVRFRTEGLAILAAQALIWLMLPRVAMAGGFIDYRVPWAMSFFLLASLVPVPGPSRLAARIGILFCSLATLRIASICFFWLAWEPALSAIDQSLATLPLGSRLMVVLGHPASTSSGRRPALEHVAAYAVARRQAFEPGIFADIPGQILHLQPHYKRPWSETPGSLDSLPAGYDYVLVLRPDLARISPALPLIRQESGPEFTLFKVDAQRPGAAVVKPDRPGP